VVFQRLTTYRKSGRLFILRVIGDYTNYSVPPENIAETDFLTFALSPHKFAANATVGCREAALGRESDLQSLRAAYGSLTRHETIVSGAFGFTLPGRLGIEGRPIGRSGARQ
jgi:hypothetical protein